jgi:hypothetical protein
LPFARALALFARAAVVDVLARAAVVDGLAPL